MNPGPMLMPIPGTRAICPPGVPRFDRTGPEPALGIWNPYACVDGGRGPPYPMFGAAMLPDWLATEAIPRDMAADVVGDGCDGEG